MVINERELIEKSKKGDEEAFKLLFEQCRSKVFQHLLGMVHDVEIAQDLTQESFLLAYQHLHEFRMQSSFYTWVYRIGHNRALDYIKKGKTHPEEEFNEKIYLPHQENVIENPEWEAALQLGLRTLSEKHRIVFQLFNIEGRSIKEIAALLNVPPGTVRSRLFYARRKLKVFLASFKSS